MQIKFIFLFFATSFILGSCNNDPNQGKNQNKPIASENTPTLIDLGPLTSTPLPEPTDAPPPSTLLFLPLANSNLPKEPLITEETPTPFYPTYNGLPIDRKKFGVQIHIHREDVPSIINHLKTLNAGWVKVQVSWKLYQPHQDEFSEERFKELDNLVEAAVSNEIAVLLSVSKAPEWSRPTTEMDGPPEDFALFQSFMAYLAGRYQGRVTAYELWNEPNLQREWNGVPLSAVDFSRLIQIGAMGVRMFDPEAILISGAPATTGINDGVHAIDDRIYFRQLIDTGAAVFVNAFGVHPYGWANPPDSRADSPNPAVPSHNDHPSFFFQDTLLDYASILNEFSIEKPLWVTEFGWGSFEGFNSPLPEGADFMAAVSEWQQAVYTLRAYQLADGWTWVGPMILWNLNFGPLLGDQFSESGYSMLRPDGTPRPLYNALKEMAKR